MLEALRVFVLNDVGFWCVRGRRHVGMFKKSTISQFFVWFQVGFLQVDLLSLVVKKASMSRAIQEPKYLGRVEKHTHTQNCNSVRTPQAPLGLSGWS